MSRWASFVSTLALALVTHERAASAQDSGAAAALFKEGLADMQAARLDVGCPKLAESYRLDLRPGVLFTLAECEARWGKLASALAHYDDYLRLYDAMTPPQQSAQRERAAVALEKKSELKPRVPTLTLNLPASAPAGTIVKREGTVLGAPSLGTAFPVDPGKHLITTQTPDGAVKEHRVAIEEGEAKTIDLELPSATALPSLAARPNEVGRRDDAGATRRPWVYAAFGLGAAGVALGTVTGVLAISKKGDIDDNCVGRICNAEGKQIADGAKTMGWVSTVGFGVGLAGVGAGLVLLLTEPKRGSMPSAAPHPGHQKVRISVSATSLRLGADF